MNELPKEQTCVLSQWSIKCALHCPRKFLYRHRWGLVPKAAQYKPAADLGSITHRLLELGRTGVATVHQEIAAKQAELMAQIEAGEDLTGNLARILNNLTDLFNKALAMAEIFWQQFPPKDYLRSMAREVTIQMDIRTQGGVVPVKGRIDHIVCDTRKNDLWLRDTKTTSKPVAQLLTGAYYNLQYRLYTYLASLQYPEPVRGFILDILQVPGIKYCPDTKDKAGFGAYINRVIKWYGDHPEQTMTSKALLFAPGTVLSGDVVAAIQAANLLNTRPLRNFDENFPRDVTGQACMAWRKQCPYYPLCDTAQVGWSVLIEQRYTVRKHHDAVQEVEEEEGDSQE